MTTQEIKNIEREKFKLLNNNSTCSQKINVRKNVDIFLRTFTKNKNSKQYIAIYWPLENEVDLRHLKKTYPVALPKCSPNKKMSFYPWGNGSLENDIHGIPSPRNEKILENDQISLIFAPCISIDRRLIRLGYGGGYFDKLRSNKSWEDIPCIGVLTSNCVSEEYLHKAEWDIPLSGFITDNEILV